MKTYLGRTVMLKSGLKGVVVGETWEGGPVLDIELSNGRVVHLPDYEVVVL